MQDQTDIKISAEPFDESTCRFTVTTQIYAGTASFDDPEDAGQFSPLAAALFDIEPVTGVRISNNVVTVTKEGIGDWLPIARQIGTAIRAHLQSGSAAVSDEYRAQIPDAEEVKRRLKQLFEAEINPAVAQHGGFIDLIDVLDNNVYIRMGGGCQGCGAANVTLKQGVERAIREVVPQIGEVYDTTDHAGGTNPYYAPTK